MLSNVEQYKGRNDERSMYNKNSTNDYDKEERLEKIYAQGHQSGNDDGIFQASTFRLARVIGEVAWVLCRVQSEGVCNEKTLSTTEV